MNNKFCSKGTISLIDAAVGTDLNFDDAQLFASNNRRCLEVSGMQVKGDILGNRAHVDGLLDMVSLRCTGDVRLADAKLIGIPANTASLGSPIDQRKGGIWRGVALRATGADITGDLDLRGSTLEQSLILTKATIGRSVLLIDASLKASGRDALVAVGLKADALHLQLRDLPIGGIDLTSASITSLYDNDTSWPSKANVKIGGFSYLRINSTLQPRDRLRWLINATADYAPQPYEQLASYYVANGKPDEARKVNLESIRRSYQTRGGLQRIWGKIQDWFIGFGYQPLRAAIIFFALWAFSGIWFSFGVGPCFRFGVRWSNLCPDALSGHPSWNPWIYALDLLLPIINLGYKSTWDATGISRLIALGLIVVGWILTTTIVAALGRTLRRP
jgi:hypothetical protein